MREASTPTFAAKIGYSRDKTETRVGVKVRGHSKHVDTHYIDEVLVWSVEYSNSDVVVSMDPSVRPSSSSQASLSTNHCPVREMQRPNM